MVVGKLTVASFMLNEYLREKIPSQYSPPGNCNSENLVNKSTQNGEWCNNLQSLQSSHIKESNNYTVDTKTNNNE